MSVNFLQVIMARNYFNQSDIISGYINSGEEDDVIESDVDNG